MLRSLGFAIAAVVLVAVARADEPAPVATNFSIFGEAVPTGFTLLEPGWLLPPIESLDLLPSADASVHPETRLPDGMVPAPAPQLSSRPASAKVGYSISDDLSAQLRYHRSRIFGASTSQTLRDDQWSSFSTQPFRDVFDLNMSLKLAGSTVGLGYQFQSARAATSADGGLTRFLPNSPQTTHSLTLGLTRQWGAGQAAPRLVDAPPLISPDLVVADEPATPTPPH